jgi:uncharacterized protein
VVLSAGEGALGKMLPVFRLGLGGRLERGRQWMSWIALEDVIRGVFFLADSAEASGPFNIVAPNPVTNADFTRALGQALHRPAFFPAPAFALRAVLGEMAGEALLASTRAVPANLLRGGFAFEVPELAVSLIRMVNPGAKA